MKSLARMIHQTAFVFQRVKNYLDLSKRRGDGLPQQTTNIWIGIHCMTKCKKQEPLRKKFKWKSLEFKGNLGLNSFFALRARSKHNLSASSTAKKQKTQLVDFVELSIKKKSYWLPLEKIVLNVRMFLSNNGSRVVDLSRGHSIDLYPFSKIIHNYQKVLVRSIMIWQSWLCLWEVRNVSQL